MGLRTRLYLAGHGVPAADTKRNGTVYVNEDGAISTAIYVKIAGVYTALTGVGVITAVAGASYIIDLLASATGEAIVKMADNLASAFEIKEGANSYLKFVTTNSAEKIEFGKPISAAAAAWTIADPGTGVAIPVTVSGVCMITTAAAETNTLAIPTFVGQRLHLICSVYAVGNRVVTASARINQATNTIMTFGAVGDSIVLEGVTIAGALRWQVISNDGVALS